MPAKQTKKQQQMQSYLITIVKIARCVCIKCSKLKISKEKYKHLITYEAEICTVG